LAQRGAVAERQLHQAARNSSADDCYNIPD
jgi:hypothetical protein